MNTEIVTLPDRWIMGTQSRIQPMSADYGTIWAQGFDPHGNEIRPLALDPGYLGVYYSSGEPGWVDFVAGMVVAEGSQPPEGCIVRALPGGLYGRIPCTMATIGSTWGQIYGQWLPASAYVEDQTRPAMEYYPPDALGPDARVTIYVALSSRA